jgi:predicted RNA-binding Zn-ribbon protein involved in translation (DUF1610 family)
MVRRRPRKTLLLCPNCGSTQVSLLAGSIVGQVYHCSKCDYVGSLILETDVAEDGTPLSDG